MARDRGREYGHIGFCDGVCHLTLAMEAGGGGLFFLFAAGSLLVVPALAPCSSIFIPAFV